ncbi:MAG: FAD-binding oxidoreductase [Gemmatimonadetes bacterium]|nr:MAG: FAD-binding oxidoreductase [Gemmatimonadota bacterium]
MTPSALPDFLNDLRPRIAGELRTDLYSRLFYSTDASIYQMMPHGVLIPRHMDDVQAAVELAHQYRIPILPRGGGSSLAGQGVNEALVIDFTPYLHQVVEINPAEQWVRVQPGIVLDQLNLQVRSYGLQFGPDPASSNRATLGGIVANNSTGSHSICYGMTADHVLDLTAILSDGSIAFFDAIAPATLPQHLRKSGLEGDIYRQIHQIITDYAETIRQGTPQHWRRAGGYNLDRFIAGVSRTPYQPDAPPAFNLAQLICGSEGTLGLIKEVKLNLVKRPHHKGLAIVHFDDLYHGLESVPVILETQPTAVELLDHFGLTMCRSVPAYARLLPSFIEGDPQGILITEYYGENDAELRSKVDHLRVHLKQNGVQATIVPAIDPAVQANVWLVRKESLGLVMSLRGDHKPIPMIEDMAVPVEHLAAYIQKVEAFCREHHTKIGYYAHASAGCLHVRPHLNTKSAQDLAKMPVLTQFCADLAGSYGGVMSSEHGDGRARGWLNERFFGTDLYQLFRQVKAAFDPYNLMNPGNVVDVGSMTDHLRVAAPYRPLPLTEKLDFSGDQGFVRAVEMCNGSGVCRKTTTGTMCPSFMATREEEHSTRGRANALRAALTGKIPPEEFTATRMFQVLDLCLSCKACKSECPSSVDMAKIKLEFLGHYYEHHPLPFRSKLFADIPRYSRLNSGMWAPFINAIGKTGLVRGVIAKALGITPQRNLLAFAKEPFTRWFEKRRRELEARDPKPQVVLFNDTFNTYHDPHIAIAATQVLETLGFTIHLPRHYCCGRPALSKGLIAQAQHYANGTLAALLPFAEQGIPIVGLEPSCLLSMRDDYHYLLKGDDRVQIVSDQCFTFEEFLTERVSAGLLEAALGHYQIQKTALLHGHCHQKAITGTEAAHRLLEIAGFTVEEIDTSCCGMAGSFGYEVEHYDISVKMAERRLLPAIRAMDATTVLVAAGTSCRHQIQDLTGKRARHPAEVLWDVLKTG